MDSEWRSQVDKLSVFELLLVGVIIAFTLVVYAFVWIFPFTADYVYDKRTEEREKYFGRS